MTNLSLYNPTISFCTDEIDTPEIRKYKKRFNSEILCAALWGVNLLIGTENGLMLLDRSGQGKVYQLISRRRFQQMEVLEGQNILVTISGKKNRVRVYYLSWLKSKILRTDTAIERRAGWINVGDLQVNFKKFVSRRALFWKKPAQTSIAKNSCHLNIILTFRVQYISKLSNTSE